MTEDGKVTKERRIKKRRDKLHRKGQVCTENLSLQVVAPVVNTAT